MRTMTLTGVCILAAAAASCGDADEGRSGLESVIRDSAGVTIVENERPAPETRLGWRIAEAPTLSIGAFEGDPAYELYQVMDAARLPDGRIVVANAGSGELRVFDASGTHLASWGGRGEGPGEFGDFAAPWSVGPWPGDSIAASDPFARRASIFDAHGVHGRTFVLGDPNYRFIGVLPNGKILLGTMASFVAGTMGTGMVRGELEYAVAAADGDLHTALGAYPDQERYIIDDDRGMRPYAQAFHHSAIARVWGDLIVIGSNDLYEIRAYSTDGELARIVRREHDVRSPTQADLDHHLAERYADNTEEERAEALAALEDMPLLEAFPAFGRVLTDSRGYLWVEDYQLPGEPAPAWTVFDPEGRVQGPMDPPSDLSLFEIGEDYVLGRVSDDIGVERVQLWSLERSDP
ncbi:hypothetical protein [Candidatus Palauibacter sp.]|uniref:hypothetical protein n=1 Tax=Candidatus Palauibacter sp. TaxID=3101350 RepID=UPI003B029D9D